MAMAPFVVVLCENAREGNTYARRAGLQRGRYRVVASASSIRGLRVAHVHELPGFAKRRDRHAINAELRWTKGERIQVEMPPAIEAPPVDQGDGMGEQLTIEDAIAETPADQKRLLEEITDPGPQEPDEDEEYEEPDEPSATTEQGEDAAPAEEEKPKRKRRRRCGECGDLVLDLDAHECAETTEPAEQPAPKVVDLGGVIF